MTTSGNSALQSLHALRGTLDDHLERLMQIKCEQNVGEQITPEESEALPALFLKETANPQPIDRQLFVNWLVNAGMSDVLAAGLADWNGIN